jgi:hypothetical protein
VAGVEGELADGDACGRVDVGKLSVMHLPACNLQELVNLNAGKSFGRHAKSNKKC